VGSVLVAVVSSPASFFRSRRALQLEIAKQYPDVHLNPGYEYDQGNDKWSLGLSVTLPASIKTRVASPRRFAGPTLHLALQVRPGHHQAGMDETHGQERRCLRLR
jgi:hypothetical protein